MHTATRTVPVSDKPKEGWASFQYFLYDAPAGLQLAIVGITFAIGISYASSVPPTAGLKAAIIGALIACAIGGRHLSIVGPAAALAPILSEYVHRLGDGDIEAGYPRLLALIVCMAIMQMIMIAFGMTRFTTWFMKPVVKGMLCGIGFMFILKQLPLFAGFTSQGVNLSVLGLGCSCLITLFAWDAFKHRFGCFKVVPPQIVVVVVGLVVSLGLGLQSQYCVSLPTISVESWIVFPDFQGLLSHVSLPELVLMAAILAFVDNMEVVATLRIVDENDPWKRLSSYLRAVFGIAFGNLAAMIGSITNIDGGMKSTLARLLGAKTRLVGLYYALFMIFFIVLAREIINLVPFTILAAILIHTGYQLCGHRIWLYMKAQGVESLVLFTFTAVMTCATNLFWGVIAGIMIKVVMNVYNSRELLPLFRNPITQCKLRGKVYRITLGRCVNLFNIRFIIEELRRIPTGAERVCLDFRGTSLLDGGVLKYELHSLPRTVHIKLIGLDRGQATKEMLAPANVAA